MIASSSSRSIVNITLSNIKKAPGSSQHVSVVTTAQCRTMLKDSLDQEKGSRCWKWKRWTHVGKGSQGSEGERDRCAI
jgi:hypothetical protein